MPGVLLALALLVFWRMWPELQPWSLQVAAFLLVISFIWRQVAGQRWLLGSARPHPLDPTVGAVVAAVGLALLATGGLESPLLPLLSLLLFVITILTNALTVTITLLGLGLVLVWGMPWPLPTHVAWELAGLVALLPLAQLARHENRGFEEEKRRASSAANTLAAEETTSLLFLSTFLIPKLRFLQENATQPDLINRQIDLLLTESQKLLRHLDEASDDQS